MPTTLTICMLFGDGVPLPETTVPGASSDRQDLNEVRVAEYQVFGKGKMPRRLNLRGYLNRRYIAPELIRNNNNLVLDVEAYDMLHKAAAKSPSNPSWIVGFDPVLINSPRKAMAALLRCARRLASKGGRALASLSCVNREQGTTMSRKWLVDFYWEPRENLYRLSLWHCLCKISECESDDAALKANIDIMPYEQEEEDPAASYDDKQGLALCSYEGLMVVRLRKSHNFRLVLGDPLANTWTNMPEPPFKAYSAAFAEDGSHTLLIGAKDGRLATYNFVDNTWTIHVAHARSDMSCHIVWAAGAFYTVLHEGQCLGKFETETGSVGWRSCIDTCLWRPGKKLHVAKHHGKLLVCVESLGEMITGCERALYAEAPLELLDKHNTFYEVNGDGRVEEATCLQKEVNKMLNTVSLCSELQFYCDGLRFYGKDDFFHWTPWSQEDEDFLANDVTFDPDALLLAIYYSREEPVVRNFSRMGRSIISYLSVCYHVACEPGPIAKTLIESLVQLQKAN